MKKKKKLNHKIFIGDFMRFIENTPFLIKCITEKTVIKYKSVSCFYKKGDSRTEMLRF